MFATIAYGWPSGYTAPIWRAPRDCANHTGALRKSSANSGIAVAASMPSNHSAIAAGTVKFVRLPPACGMAWNEPWLNAKPKTIISSP